MRRAVFAAGVLALFCMAPTAGDVGGCGAEITEMNAEQFVLDRKDLDCARCGECGIASGRCTRACDPAKAPDTTIPETCRPVSHDARVCLRALEAASCGTFATYVADEAPALPSECEFCKHVPDDPLPPFAVDAGAP
ncbi:MAG: hypothetical protein KIT84_35250 [Labilithrix sp.]|nr:hypothetical protein [Labilithrix sp.]MCW5816308.1 hypothetical protein [Labilithrix sp.]